MRVCRVFHLDGEKFDYIILSDLVGFLYDIRGVLDHIRSACHAETRIIIHWYSMLWQPIISLAERIDLNTRCRSTIGPPERSRQLALPGGFRVSLRSRCRMPGNDAGLGPTFLINEMREGTALPCNSGIAIRSTRPQRIRRRPAIQSKTDAKVEFHSGPHLDDSGFPPARCP